MMKQKEISKLISNNLAMIITVKDALESLSEACRINAASINKLAKVIKILERRLSKLEDKLIIPLDVAEEFQIEEDW